jgi:hypothetical protein
MSERAVPQKSHAEVAMENGQKLAEPLNRTARYCYDRAAQSAQFSGNGFTEAQEWASAGALLADLGTKLYKLEYSASTHEQTIAERKRWEKNAKRKRQS